MSLPNNPSQADVVKAIRSLENTDGSITGDTLPIGSVMEWYSDLIPVNWLLLDGRAISRIDYAELFAIIGTTYGEGNGVTTFNLPDRRGNLAVGKDENDTDFDTLGKKSGSKNIALTLDNMPTHTHIFTGTAHNHGLNSHTHTYDKVNSPTGAASGNTGSHTLTTSEMPSHKHTLIGYNTHGSQSGSGIGATNIDSNAITQGTKIATVTAGSNLSGAMSNTGGGGGHTHSLNSHTHTTSTTSTSTGKASGNTADTTASGTNSEEGNGTAFDIMNPNIVANFIIKAKQSSGIIAEVEDNLNSTNTTNALSANQGRILNEKIDKLGESIKYLDSSNDVLFVTEPRKIYM